MSKARISRVASALLGFTVLAFSCLPGPEVPDVAPRGVLGLRELALEEGESGPLEVVYAAPQGVVSGPAEITILFNRAMRDLGDATRDAGSFATVDPPIDGAWQWTGSRALTFVPARAGGGGSTRLPHATAFAVTVPKGTKALSGDELGEEMSFEFETPRPELESTSPSDESRGLTPETKFELRMSQPVSKESLAKHLSLTVAGAPVSFSVDQAEADNAKRFVVTPSAPLALASAIELTQRAGLVGLEGPLPAEEDVTFTYRTYGPLAMTRVACSWGRRDEACENGSGVTIDFSNAVSVKTIKSAISVSPPVKLKFPSWLDDEDFRESIPIEANFAPGRTYTITVKAPLMDEYGQVMAANASGSVTFANLEPEVLVGLSEGILEPRQGRVVEVGHVNAASVSVAAFKLDEDTILRDHARRLSPEELAKAASASFVSAKQSRLNVVERVPVSLDRVLGGDRGPFGIVTSYQLPGAKSATLGRTVAQVTDLAVSAKLSREGSTFIVTQLSDAKRVAGAEVRIRRENERTLSKTTDADGVATFSKDEFVPQFDRDDGVVFVKTKDDTAYYALSDNIMSGTDPSDEHPLGLVFDDLGIYRPGDLVRIKGVVRTPENVGLSTPSGTPVVLAVEGPSGEVLQKMTATLSSFGTFATTVAVPRTGRLGSYAISLWHGNTVIASDAFEVAEYRPSEFKVRAESDKPSYIRGDAARWTVGGDYLYGAPMVGAGSATTIGRARTSFAPPNTEGFETSDDTFALDLPNQSQSASDLTESQVPLDAAGSATLSAKLDLPGQIGPELVRCDTEVSDLTRQVISSATSAVVHPAEHYVGVSLADAFVGVGTDVAPQLLASKPDGERVVGAPLRVSLIKRKWTVAKQGVGADVTTVSSPVDETLGTCDLRSAARPVSCKLTPKVAGYYIVRVTSEDARKNPVSASTSLYVTGGDGDAFASFEETDETSMELVLDKESYSVGDKARVLVKSPWKNVDALVTVERRGVFTRRWVTLTGAAPLVEIPVTEDFRPNVYVSVLALKKRTKPAPTDWLAPDVGAPAYRLGVAEIPVETASRRLTVDVAPSKQSLKPGDDVTVALKVKDAAGKGAPAEVTLVAADLGVLSLVGYEIPDPADAFQGARALGVSTLESRSEFASLFSPLSGLDKGDAGGGGGGEGGPSATRSDFRASAYYNASIITNDQGEASVTFKLPDGLTTYRMMALAVAKDDRMGRGEADVTTSRDLMVRPAVPRFLRAGDTFTAACVVTGKGAAAQDVEVAAMFTGAAIDGQTSQTVRVEPGQSVEVKFLASVPKGGPVTLRFDAKSAGASDSVSVTRTAMVPAVMEAVALYGNTDSAAAEKLGDLSSVRGDVGELTITTSSTALVGLDAGGQQLLEYPYGCTEQLTSKLVPLVALKDLQKDFGFPVPANMDDVVEKTVAKILTHQRYDGEFGLWADSPATNAWATVYATWGLSMASKFGYAVPDGALADARRATAKIAEASSGDVADRVGPFALLVLAEMGMPDAARATVLYERRTELPLYSQAMLVSAMVLGKNDPEQIAELAKRLEARVQLDGAVARTVENLGSDYAPYLDSNTRTSALVLSALLRTNPKHPLAPALAGGLLVDRRGSAWRTTQEAAWALLALGEYRRAFEAETPNFFARTFFGDEVLLEQAFKGRSLAEEKATLPIANLLGDKGTQMTFVADGPGRLYYQARLRYARSELPKTPVDRGFFVEKRMRVVTPKNLREMLRTVPTETKTSVEAGDLVLVDLTVVSPKTRSFVAIDDPLPAGFEAVDSRLSTTSARLADLSGPDQDADDAAMEREEGEAYFTQEVRDDRVLYFVDDLPPGVFRYRYLARATTRGAFVMPPTHASEMYAPEVFGRTGASTVSVK